MVVGVRVLYAMGWANDLSCYIPYMIIVIYYFQFFNDCVRVWPPLQTMVVMATMLLTGWPCYWYMVYNVFIIINYTNYYFNYIYLCNTWPLPSMTVVTLSAVWLLMSSDPMSNVTELSLGDVWQQVRRCVISSKFQSANCSDNQWSDRYGDIICWYIPSHQHKIHGLPQNIHWNLIHLNWRSWFVT